jgi:uncharacterized protein (DUF433 family)
LSDGGRGHGRARGDSPAWLQTRPDPERHALEEVSYGHPDRIEVNLRVMLGKPVIQGTRIPVELILRKLSEGARETDLLAAYPRLTREDIQAAIACAADAVAYEETILVEPPRKRAKR